MLNLTKKLLPKVCHPFTIGTVATTIFQGRFNVGGEQSRRRNIVIFCPLKAVPVLLCFLLPFLFFSSVHGEETDWISKARENPLILHWAAETCQRLGLYRVSFDYSGHKNRVPLQNQCLNRQVGSILDAVETGFTDLKMEYVQLHAAFLQYLEQPNPQVSRVMTESVELIQARSEKILARIRPLSIVGRIDNNEASTVFSKRSLAQEIIQLAVMLSDSEIRVKEYLAGSRTIHQEAIKSESPLSSISRIPFQCSQISFYIKNDSTSSEEIR